MLFRCFLILTSAYFSTYSLLGGQTDAFQRIDQRAKAKINGFQGKVSAYAKNLSTGVSYGILPDQTGTHREHHQTGGYGRVFF
jgi:hypothetical protein